MSRLNELTSRTAKSLLGSMLIAMSLCFVGCGPHQITGSVVQGPAAGAYVVSASDSRLNQMTVNNVSIDFTLDPSSMRPKQIGRAVTDHTGKFSLPVDEMGAGSWQEYDLGVMVNHEGYKGLWQVIQLPTAGKKLLIILTPGQGGARRPDDVLGETMKLKEMLMDNN